MTKKQDLINKLKREITTVHGKIDRYEDQMTALEAKIANLSDKDDRLQERLIDAENEELSKLPKMQLGPKPPSYGRPRSSKWSPRYGYSG